MLRFLALKTVNLGNNLTLKIGLLVADILALLFFFTQPYLNNQRSNLQCSMPLCSVVLCLLVFLSSLSKITQRHRPLVF